MNSPLLRALGAGLLAAGALTAPAQAQTTAAATAPVAPGIGIANLEAVIANSNAFRAAQQQRQTTYKAQFDQAKARQTAIEAQLKPLADKFNADRAASNPNQASLAQQAQTIQTIQQSGQQELQGIMQPVALSQAYVTEQIEDKLDQATKAAMVKAKISLLLNPQAVFAATASAYDLTQAILAELNALIPSAQLVPPAGWLPREQRDQQAQAQAQPAPAAPAGKQPQGR